MPDASSDSAAPPTKMFRCFAAFSKQDPTMKPHAYEPRPLGPMDVEILISHCGVCGSDIHTIDSGWGPTNYPICVGHEIVGTVVDLGAEVREHKIGDRVGVGAMSYACWREDCEECSAGIDNCCPREVDTYNDKYSDGAVSQGGYAERVRTDARHVIPIPEALKSEHAAPLLCGGVTVYAPLARWGAGPGKVVGVVGIGGLGHLGLLFAKALGATTIAVSSSDAKKEDAKKLGVDGYISTADGSPDVAAWKRKIDILLITGNANDETTLTKYMSMVKVRGTAILVGLPEAPLQFPGKNVIVGEKNLVGSLIGSVKTIKEMLAFAAEKQVLPWVEMYELRECNKAIEAVRRTKIRFRAVLTVDALRDF